jgi:hypothetical protein
LRDIDSRFLLTIEEELDRLEENIRRLKIEYESFFAGGSPRPPRDTVFRVETAIKKYNSGIADLNFSQKFRFNQLAQRYAVYNDLWRRKLRESEEGPPARTLPRSDVRSRAVPSPFRVVCSDPENEREKVAALLQAYLLAKREAGEASRAVEPELFAKFVCDKVRQIKKSSSCDKVEFSVHVEAGKVKLKVAGA